MSAILIVCAVAVLFWGYQFVAIEVAFTEFPPLFFLALRFLAIALLLTPLVRAARTSTVGPITAISIGGLNFGASSMASAREVRDGLSASSGQAKRQRRWRVDMRRPTSQNPNAIAAIKEILRGGSASALETNANKMKTYIRQGAGVEIKTAHYLYLGKNPQTQKPCSSIILNPSCSTALCRHA